jgi:ABC-2 type transport system permease protein
MPERMAGAGQPHKRILATPVNVPVEREAARSPSILHLLEPKWLTIRSRATRGRRVGLARLTVLGFTGCVFWALMIFVLARLLRYFRGVPEIGVLLAGKLLGLVFLCFFSILLLSNVITALSSFFLARDLDLLVSAPVDWLRLYCAKLLETMVNSSWMVTLMAVPILIAYGWVYEGGPVFVLVSLTVFLPFLVLPSVVGSAITVALVRIFPARRTRDILGVIAALSAAGIVLLFRLLRPEQLARPEGFRSLVDFIAILRTPASPFLPSEWARCAIMASLSGETDFLPFLLLWSSAGAFVVLGALVHQKLYAAGFTKAQEGGRKFARGTFLRGAGQLLLSPFGTLRKELVLKEVRLFFRDTTQWSQLILLGVLVAVYIFNVKFLPLRGDGLTFFLVNVIPFLNLVLAGFVLASVAARFIFPSVSLEGRTLWLLKSSPMPVRALLWAKFWMGALPLLVLALGIVAITNILLMVSPFMMFVSIFTITFMTLAIAGLALGLGAMFPQYETENAAQIPTSFGGLIFMMSAVALIATVTILEARPVYGYLSAQAFGTAADPTEMLVGFSAATLLCVAATFIPISIALRRLEAVEL